MENCKLYRIVPELKIIIEYLSGDIKVTDFINHRIILIEDKDYNPNFNSIIDFGNTNFIGIREDIDAYVNFTRSTPKMIGKRRTAILANTPHQTVIPIVYHLEIQDLPLEIEVFSTLASAIKWVNLNANDLALIEFSLNEMQNREKILI